MGLFVALKDVVNAQDLHLPYVAPSASGQPQVNHLIFYTGWLPFNHQSSSFGTNDVASFVPNQDGTLDILPEDMTDAIVTASLTSFLDDPDTAAVDRAAVHVKQFQFPGLGGSQSVLVLDAALAVNGGSVRRLAYQVTVHWPVAKIPQRISIDPGSHP